MELFAAEPFVVESVLPEKDLRDNKRYYQSKKKEKNSEEEHDIVDEVEISPEAMKAFEELK